MPFGYPFSVPFGGGPDEVEVGVTALQASLAPGWGDDLAATEHGAEVDVMALAAAMVWAVNGRVTGQMVPGRMLETLPTWEAACNLRPALRDLPIERRAQVASRFAGYVGNAASQIYDACAAALGSLFLGLAVLGETATVNYSPGLFPGPPGTPWSSNRATVAVRILRSGLPDAAFLDLVRRLRVTLQILCPAWLTFVVGTDEGGAIAGVALAGLTLVDS